MATSKTPAAYIKAVKVWRCLVFPTLEAALWLTIAFVGALLTLDGSNIDCVNGFVGGTVTVGFVVLFSVAGTVIALGAP